MGINKNKKRCWHRITIDLVENRKTYPFGKNSRPFYTFKKIFGEKCKNCGAYKLFKSGDRKWIRKPR